AHVRRSESVGARAEDVPMPEPQSPGIENMETPVKYNYGTFRVTRPTIKASQNEAGAWVSALKLVMDDIKESETFDVARQMVFGDGTGRLAQVAGGVASAATQTITVDNPGVDYLRVNMVIDIYNGATLERDSGTITAVNKPANQITVTFAAAAAVSDNAFIYREDAKDSEMMGLGGIVDDGSRLANFQGLSRATNDWLKANVLANGGALRPLTLDLIDRGYLEAESSANGGYPTAIYSRHIHALKYAQLMKTDRHWDPKQMTLDGGWRAVEYTGPGGTCPWIMDRTVRRNEVLMVHEPDLALWVLSPMQFVDDDGHILHRSHERKDAFDGYLASYEQLGAHRCDRHTVIKDLAEA
ncbi:MAG TPA: phage major capsid protein, partial [Armatimonadota bacterium]|nr:phage major capsid protein [Armatimonadota bacterium]